MQAANRDTDSLLQSQQLLHDADTRGLQTLGVLSKSSFFENDRFPFVCIQVTRHQRSRELLINTH